MANCILHCCVAVAVTLGQFVCAKLEVLDGNLWSHQLYLLYLTYDFRVHQWAVQLALAIWLGLWEGEAAVESFDWSPWTRYSNEHSIKLPHVLLSSILLKIAYGSFWESLSEGPVDGTGWLGKVIPGTRLLEVTPYQHVNTALSQLSPVYVCKQLLTL